MQQLALAPSRTGQSYPCDALAVALQRLHGARAAQCHALGAGALCQLAGEQMAIACFVVGQAQPASDRCAGACQRWLRPYHPGSIQQLKGHTTILQHGHIAGSGVELGLAAKQLQGALAAGVVVNAGFCTPGA